MQGDDDPQNRRTMRWEERAWDQTIRGFYKKLVEIRRSRRELREGRLLMLGEYLDGDALAFVRHTEVPNQETLAVVNKSKQRLRQRLLVPYTPLRTEAVVQESPRAGSVRAILHGRSSARSAARVGSDLRARRWLPSAERLEGDELCFLQTTHPG